MHPDIATTVIGQALCWIFKQFFLSVQMYIFIEEHTYTVKKATKSSVFSSEARGPQYQGDEVAIYFFPCIFSVFKSYFVYLCRLPALRGQHTVLCHTRRQQT
jgi:hypothetical protein